MYYPIMLDLKDRKVLVVGGGRVAYRKIKSLIKAEANISILSPEFTSEFRELENNKALKLRFIEDEYSKEYLEGCFLVIAATSNRSVNEKVSFDARDENILCNIVDNKDISDFITPAIVDKEEILISVCTNGKYPALSKYIRRDLDGRYERFNEEYLSILEEFRLEVIKRNEDNKEELMSQVLDLDLKELKDFHSKYMAGI